MINIKLSTERGYANHGWLESYHSFSFADYYDPRSMHFRDLRVINEDFVEPGQGFGTHPHKNMEIITYVLEGALEHKDSMGNGSVIKPGDVQYMSAGSGVTHSEFNHSDSDKVHLLQIWIIPGEEFLGATPRYGQIHLEDGERNGQLRLIASGKKSTGGKGQALEIRGDVDLYASILKAGEKTQFSLRSGRGAWVQMVRGELLINGKKLEAGDAAALQDESSLSFEGKGPESEFLLFDLA